MPGVLQDIACRTLGDTCRALQMLMSQFEGHNYNFFCWLFFFFFAADGALHRMCSFLLGFLPFPCVVCPQELPEIASDLGSLLCVRAVLDLPHKCVFAVGFVLVISPSDSFSHRSATCVGILVNVFNLILYLCLLRHLCVLCRFDPFLLPCGLLFSGRYSLRQCQRVACVLYGTQFASKKYCSLPWPHSSVG